MRQIQYMVINQTISNCCNSNSAILKIATENIYCKQNKLVCDKISTINRTPNLHVPRGISDSVPSNDNIMKIIILRKCLWKYFVQDNKLNNILSWISFWNYQITPKSNQIKPNRWWTKWMSILVLRLKNKMELQFVYLIFNSSMVGFL